LVLWPIRDEQPPEEKNKIANSALAAFVRTIQEVNASRALLDFCLLPEVQKAIPGFRISMGFGLHMGWAIEGAVGSNLKIDATYLSPNVNISSRLEVRPEIFSI
jgi:class 3 adenylate cyclase